MSKHIIGLSIYTSVGLVIAGLALGVCDQLDIQNKGILMAIGYWTFSLSAAVSRGINQ